MRDGRPVPPVEATAPGVWSVPAPLPGSALGYSLLYLVEHAAGLVMVDAGIDNEPTRAALGEALGRADRDASEITDVILTHHHPDHTGLAERVRGLSGARVAIGEGDAAALRDPFGAFVDRFERELRLAGTPEGDLERMLENMYASAGRAGTRGIEPDAVIVSGQPLAFGGAAGAMRFETLHLPGHTKGHIVLEDHERRLLLCGDVLLPSGTVQLDLVSEPSDDPLGELLASLAMLEGLDAELALPGHGGAFRDVAVVAGRQRRRQLRRRDRVAALLAEDPDLTAWDASARLSRRPWGELSVVARRYATMETAAVMRGLGALGLSV